MPIKSLGKKKKVVFVGLVVILTLYYLLASAPSNYPNGEVINIPKGSSAREISEILEEKDVIRSPVLLRGILLLSGNELRIFPGDYQISGPEGVFSVAYRLTTGGFGFTSVKVTIPEGTVSFGMPKLLGNDFLNLNKEKFLKLAESKEGYLFPDTYLIHPNATEEEVIKLMTDTFDEKIKKYSEDVRVSGKSLGEIIIMASLIERETKKPEDRGIVSGILWKRLSMKMPLQVDAVFAYVSDKSTYDLTVEDLKKDSPYNTYTRVGLPPTPICSPGLDSIIAAIHPKQSKYLYVLYISRSTRSALGILGVAVKPIIGHTKWSIVALYTP